MDWQLQERFNKRLNLIKFPIDNGYFYEFKENIPIYIFFKQCSLFNIIGHTCISLSIIVWTNVFLNFALKGHILTIVSFFNNYLVGFTSIY